jgi:hypothetical protein
MRLLDLRDWGLISKTDQCIQAECDQEAVGKTRQCAKRRRCKVFLMVQCKLTLISDTCTEDGCSNVVESDEKLCSTRKSALGLDTCQLLMEL